MPQQFHFASSQQEGPDSLGIIVHHGSMQVVVKTPVIGGTGAERDMCNRAGNTYVSRFIHGDET